MVSIRNSLSFDGVTPDRNSRPEHGRGGRGRREVYAFIRFAMRKDTEDRSFDESRSILEEMRPIFNLLMDIRSIYMGVQFLCMVDRRKKGEVSRNSIYLRCLLLDI